MVLERVVLTETVFGVEWRMFSEPHVSFEDPTPFVASRKLCYVKLPLELDRSCFGILRSVELWFSTDVSGHPIPPIFKGQGGTYRLSRNVSNKLQF
jgi:hypothetical protein